MFSRPLVIACFAISQTTQIPVQRPSSATREAWRRGLARIAAVEHTNLFVDVDLREKPSVPRYADPHGREAMFVLAGVMDRTWQQVQGAQVFRRGLAEDDPSNKVTLGAQILDWVSSLSPDAMSRMVDGTASLSDIPEAVRNAAVRFAISGDAGLAGVYLDRSDQFSVGLKLL